MHWHCWTETTITRACVGPMAKKKPGKADTKSAAKAAKKAKAAQKIERKEKKKAGKSKDDEDDDQDLEAILDKVMLHLTPLELRQFTRHIV